LIRAADLSGMLPEMLPRLWNFALRISGDQRDAEELVQRACFRALERAHQLQPDTAPLSWMFSVVHTTWINELRAPGVRSRLAADAAEAFPDTGADPDVRAAGQNALNGLIVRAVQRLPEAQRVVMLLVAIEGLSYKEAAVALDVPIGTIMSRLWHARQAIEARFGAGKKQLVETRETEETRPVGRNEPSTLAEKDASQIRTVPK
jgi:RNA polymerase sigma-70 factor (ECF subfamily)